LKKISYPLQGDSDLDVLLSHIGDDRFVLIGEASHGTHEYYLWRSRLTKKLIAEKGFTIVAVEGDWPDCYQVNRYVKNYENSGISAKDVLKGFHRWPTWMWANWETIAFVEWLRKHNDNLSKSDCVGFYGLDVYSLWESMEAIFSYAKDKYPEAIPSILEAMDCFEPFNIKAVFFYADRNYGMPTSCQKELEKLLADIRKKIPLFEKDLEASFNAEQNALIAKNAEHYYHSMLVGGESTWNIRDKHMADTVDRLMDHYGDESKIVIWAHNTHIGDARATSMRSNGLLNIGQIIQEKYASEGVFRIGFGSYEGNVIAGEHWGAPMKRTPVPPAKDESWEQLLHLAESEDKILFTKDLRFFHNPIGHRAIGVVYDPEDEYGNYVQSVIPERYEAFIYIDKSQALHPIHVKTDTDATPETYPFGI
tara:strand:+ start:28197 stop:29462 length:1266 start_codon:yes stop_codon:yes gene_type:complete